MAAIGIPNRGPWIVGQRAYRALLDQLCTELENSEDRRVAVQARGLGGLDLGLLPDDQARRICSAMARTAKEIRSGIESTPGASDWDSSFAELMATLETRLHGLTDE